MEPICVGRDAVQFRDCDSVVLDLWCHYPVPRHPELAASVAVRVEPLGQDHRFNALHGTTVRRFFRSRKEKKETRSLTTSLHLSSGLKITCNPEEFTVFNPPLGETCATWANDFVQYFGGYLDNPAESALCRYCPIAVGDEYYTPLNIRFDNRWRDVWLIFAFFGMSSLPRPPRPCRLC